MGAAASKNTLFNFATRWLFSTNHKDMKTFRITPPPVPFIVAVFYSLFGFGFEFPWDEFVFYIIQISCKSLAYLIEVIFGYGLDFLTDMWEGNGIKEIEEVPDSLSEDENGENLEQPKTSKNNNLTPNNNSLLSNLVWVAAIGVVFCACLSILS
jgi:hypothetical protein